MKIDHYVSALQLRGLISLVPCGLLAIGGVVLHAQAQDASGGGTYFVMPGVRSQFQFNVDHVQCKVGHTVLPDGTAFQMFMFSTSVDSVTIDSAAKSVTITGSMVSIVDLRSPIGTTVRMSETVPYTAYAKEGGTPGAQADFFSVIVLYDAHAPGPNQFDLFGSPATFAGDLLTGSVTVK